MAQRLQSQREKVTYKGQQMKHNLNLVNATQSCFEQCIEEFEKALMFRLPSDYREFLLRNNGGEPEGCLKFPIRAGRLFVLQKIEMFYSLENVKTLRSSSGGQGLPDFVIPIAASSDDQTLHLLLNNLHFGTIISTPNRASKSSFFADSVVVADSFSYFCKSMMQLDAESAKGRLK